MPTMVTAHQAFGRLKQGSPLSESTGD